MNQNGEVIAAVDHQGHVYVFDLERNRYHHVCNCGSSPTALCWNDYRTNEILVALTTYEIRCYDVVSNNLVSTLKGHTSHVHSISIHSAGRYALSSSVETTILWDLNTFTKKRSLVGAQNVGIQKVFFLRNSNKIISCFKDDSIFVWNCETMKCLYQLNGPIDKKMMIKTLANSVDSRVLVAGGRSKYLFFWNLDSRQLIQIIELPEKVENVKHVEFITNKLSVNQSQMVAVLSQDGIIRFIEPHSCSLKIEIGCREKRVHHFTVNQNTHYLTAILDNGNISVHHIGEIISPKAKSTEIQKVRTVKSDTSKPTKKKKKAKMSDDFAIGLQEDKKDSLYRPLPEGLSMKRLKFILSGYGEYPEKYRLFIWKNILQLPENHGSFSSLVERGTHLAYIGLHETFPIKSRKLLRVLQRVLSALTNWSPIFAETDYLPLMVFPFVKLFPNNQLVCFEIVATILFNWCQKWFEFFPNPPISVLSSVEKLLSHHDSTLLDHFVRLELSAVSYAWPLMHTLFSEVFTKEEWLVVWDHIFTNHPSFIICFVVSYLICSRRTLLATSCKDDFEFFFHHRNAVDLSSVVKEAYRIFSSTPEECSPFDAFNAFRPLTKDQYPVMNAYPKFVVNYLIEERERIRQEELEYLRQKEEALKLRQQKELLHEEEVAFYRDQAMLVKAEDERRSLIKKEEEKLVKQRKKLQRLRKELAQQDLANCDEVRRKFLQHQRLLKDIELRRLDDELEKKREQRVEEKENILIDAEINGLQVESEKRKLEEALLRNDIDKTIHGEDLARILRHNLPDRQEHKKYHLRACANDSTSDELRLSTLDELRTDHTVKELTDFQHRLKAYQLNNKSVDVDTLESTDSDSFLSTRRMGEMSERRVGLMSHIRDLRLQIAKEAHAAR